MEPATEKEGDEEVLTEGVQTETDRGGMGTEVERGEKAVAAIETRAEREGRGVKIGSEERLREAERGPTEGESAPFHLSHQTAQGLVTGLVQEEKRKSRKNRRKC